MLEHGLSVLADGCFDGVVARSMEVMVNSSEKATKGRSANVCVAVMVQIVVASGRELHDGVEGERNTNSGVEASAELVGSSDAAKKSENDNHGSANTDSITSSVLSFNHQDDGDEDESAHDLVDKNLEIHAEAYLSGSVVGMAGDWVSRGKDGNGGILFTVGAEVCKASSENTAKDLSEDDQAHEQKVLSFVSKSAPDADCDSRVEVSSSDISEDDDRRQEGEGDRKWQVG